MDGFTLVSRIKYLCWKHNIKMSKFYKDCDVTSGAVSQWKAGLTKPAMSTLQKIAAYFDVSVAYLIGEEDDKPRSNVTEIIVPKDAELAAYLQKIKDELGLMFDLNKVASIDEIKATVAFFKTLRAQGRDDE